MYTVTDKTLPILDAQGELMGRLHYEATDGTGQVVYLENVVRELNGYIEMYVSCRRGWRESGLELIAKCDALATELASIHARLDEAEAMLNRSPRMVAKGDASGVTDYDPMLDPDADGTHDAAANRYGY